MYGEQWDPASGRPDELRSDSGRGVIATAFDLLTHIRAWEPARLVDIAESAGVPRPTVHRMLTQLIAVGAVRKDGNRYRLGPSLLALGGQVSPHRQLRQAARRPLAELAARTGACVALIAAMGADAVYLDLIDAHPSLTMFDAAPPMPDIGEPVPVGSASAKVHGIGAKQANFAIDIGQVVPGLNCVAVAIPLPGGDHASVMAAMVAPRPPQSLLVAVRSTAARISAFLANAPTAAATDHPHATTHLPLTTASSHLAAHIPTTTGRPQATARTPTTTSRQQSTAYAPAITSRAPATGHTPTTTSRPQATAHTPTKPAVHRPPAAHP